MPRQGSFRSSWCVVGTCVCDCVCVYWQSAHKSSARAKGHTIVPSLEGSIVIRAQHQWNCISFRGGKTRLQQEARVALLLEDFALETNTPPDRLRNDDGETVPRYDDISREDSLRLKLSHTGAAFDKARILCSRNCCQQSRRTKKL